MKVGHVLEIPELGWNREAFEVKKREIQNPEVAEEEQTAIGVNTAPKPAVTEIKGNHIPRYLVA